MPTLHTLLFVLAAPTAPTTAEGGQMLRPPGTKTRLPRAKMADSALSRRIASLFESQGQRVKRVLLVSSDWTPEGDEVTSELVKRTLSVRVITQNEGGDCTAQEYVVAQPFRHGHYSTIVNIDARGATTVHLPFKTVPGSTVAGP